MLSRFFIYRPVFAWVIAILIMAGGGAAIFSLPVAQYPDVAPPTINITSMYPGASAKTLEDSVTRVIEQQLAGLDNLLYFSSSGSSDGSMNITLTFAPETNPDTALVQVQNKVQQAQTQLPPEVQQQGVVVTKARSDYLLIMALYDKSDRASSTDIADWLVSNIQDPVSRIKGVGDFKVFGSQYAMRIWLDPGKLLAYSLIPSDIKKALEAWNVQVAAGKIGGQPSSSDQQLIATIQAQSRLQSPEQFRNIIIKTRPSGATVRIRDVARVELGSENYKASSTLNGHPAAGLAIMLAPGANALETAVRVKQTVETFRQELPPGYNVAWPKDNTSFIRMSVKDVIQTLFEAIILVVVVMYLFLQNLRATLIPALAVPVVLLGTFGILAGLGYSINTLTLFAMVLATGLLVDDAIVVVENVERIMQKDDISPQEATVKSMQEISGALIAITLVLSSVFLPMSFFGGSTGVIYRQFSVTIVSAMVLSLIVALVFTPALCSSLLCRHSPGATRKGFFHHFNRMYHRTECRYQRGIFQILRRPVRVSVIYLVIITMVVLLMWFLPGGFLPVEDQGLVIVQYQLPPGATLNRTKVVGREISQWFVNHEQKNIRTRYSIDGTNFSGTGDNAGMMFISLRDTESRQGQQNSAQAIAARANQGLRDIPDAIVNVLLPPAVEGMGETNGFTFELMANSNTSRNTLQTVRDALVKEAGNASELRAVRVNEIPPMPQLKIEIDSNKATVLGINIDDVTQTLSAATGGIYVNDFNDRGRVKNVYIQGDAPFRSNPSDLGKWFVRASRSDGTTVMTPFSAFLQTRWGIGAETLNRYNGQASYEISGENATGYSSGVAMSRMEKLADKLPPGISWQWSGLSYQEKLAGGQAISLYSISIIVVYLCLAALYESWMAPLPVILIIPLGLVGTAFASTLRGLANDVYFQVGLLTIIGLSCKNAILIVEFAENEIQQHKTAFFAIIRAARKRLRPIIMTSLAFIMGALPLALASGDGANSRISIGTGMVGGTLTATMMIIYFAPFFILNVKLLSDRMMSLLLVIRNNIKT